MSGFEKIDCSVSAIIKRGREMLKKTEELGVKYEDTIQYDTDSVFIPDTDTIPPIKENSNFITRINLNNYP